MKKWGQVGMLVVGVIVALWVAVVSLLAPQAHDARDEAEKALRQQLGVPASSVEESEPVIAIADAAPVDAGYGDLTEDVRERWRAVFEQVEGLFYRDNDLEAEGLRVMLCLSYEWPVDWSYVKMDELQDFLAEYAEVIDEIVALTKLDVPPAAATADELNGGMVIEEMRIHEGIEGCTGLLTVASAVHAEAGNSVEAQDELTAALRLVKGDTVGWSRAIDITALDVPADNIFRSGVLSVLTLSQMAPELEQLTDKQVFADGMKNEARGLLWRSERPIHEQQYLLRRRAAAYAQKMFFGPLYERKERTAFVHAGQLSELASSPYWEIRDELTRIEKEAQPHWYDSTVPEITDGSLNREFVYQARWEARRDMVRVAIALEEHYAGHHSYPESLSAIAAVFDDELPVDVFTGDAYHYLRVDDGFVLHSCGKDGIDDGGDGDDVVLRVTRDRE